MSLAVNAKGEALITYTRTNGAARHVLVWGALNALSPTSGSRRCGSRPTTRAAGASTETSSYWKTFKNACRPYDGPQLADFVAGCEAPDGSYWAVQSWQRILPVRGFPPWLDSQSALELHVSHWTGPLADVELYDDWPFSHETEGIFGQFTYDGQPVYGFGTTSVGAPTDRYGAASTSTRWTRSYGPGWKRETAIVLRNPDGTFCYSFWPTNDVRPGTRPTRAGGPGAAYRVR